MELVYLWVENYKNIHYQGFNFSPRFECKYKNDKLTICDKKKKKCEDNNYIENFFGDNINVTAIVGKNGSGKSSLLSFLNDRIYETIDNYESNYKDTFITNKIILVYNSLEKKIIIYSDFLKKENIVNNNILIEFVEKTSYKAVFFNEKNINLDKLKEEREIIDFLSKENISLPFLAPEYLSIGFHDNFSNFNEFINISYEKLNIHGNKEEQLLAYEIYLMIAYLKTNNLKCKNCNMDKLEINIIIKKLREEINDNSILDKIKNILTIIENKFVYSKKYNNLVIKIKDLPSTFIHEYNQISKITKKGIDIRNDILLFDFLPKISSGEYQFLLLFSELNNILQDKANNLLCIDEMEVFLHPSWQRLYINWLMSFLLTNFKNRKIHIILTSHSPFLLSDIPKQNIIFLDKDEKGNCKVVDGLKEKKQTFGANIHTLLSDSFFMEDGLMGEFAKSKIDDVINYLHDRESKIKSDDEAQKLIHIIGEPIVKNQLQRMLDSKKIDYLSKDVKEEIELLKQKIEILSKRI